MSSRRYVAFISYSHKDAKWANWLHKSLESYRVPSKLISSDSDLTIPKRLVPIFKDREELPASSSLSESIKNAISNSDAMIVICSPNAAQSHFVNEEILTYKRLGMGERLLPLIVGGEPNSDGDECFPPSLKYKLDDSGSLSDDLDEEPIGADARPGKDSRNAAKLKIIAGLLGVGFDDLRQREARKRLKLMGTITTAALAVMFLTITLAITAYYSKQEAQRRGAQAEDLIGFMLGDLRARLEPLGKLDLLDAVGDKAMDYFASLKDEDLTPETLLGRARALRQIGEVRMSQGDLDEALAAFQLSNNQALRLLDVYETPDPVQFEAGQSHFWIGYVHYERNEVDQARRQFENYLKLSQTLLSREPNNTSYRKEVAYAHSNLGTLDLKVNRFAQAESHYREAESIKRAMVAASPDDLGSKKDLAETWSWLGEIAWQSGNIGSAASWFRQEYELRTLIVSKSNNMLRVEELATAASWLGREELLAGQLKSATRHLEEAHELGIRLVQHDGENAWWRLVHAHTGVALSRVAAAKGDLPAALRHIDAVIADIRKVADTTAFQTAKRHLLIAKALAGMARNLCLEKLQTQDDYYWALADLGETAVILGDLDEAEERYTIACQAAGENLADLSTTRRQARLLLDHLGFDRHQLDHCFEIPRVVVFAGHMIDQPGRPATRFPAALEKAVYAEIAARLQDMNVGIGYTSAACGSDILFIEAMLERKSEVNIVLPNGETAFRKASVDIIPDSDWGERFEKVLRQATSVITANENSSLTSAAGYEYTYLLQDGLAVLHGKVLDTKVLPLAVWNRLPGDGVGGTTSFVEHWRSVDREPVIIDTNALLGQSGATAAISSGSGETARQYADATSDHPFPQEIVAMIFCDVKEYSLIMEEDIPLFVEHFMGAVEDLLQSLSDKPLFRNTWGDAVHCVFSSLRHAGNFALDLRDRISSIAWEQKGLPRDLNYRMSLHAGPVFAFKDPILKVPNYTGSHVTRTSRIEDVTPPGEIYASEQFAALSSSLGIGDFTFDYVGLVSLPKKSGTKRLYLLRRAN